ncbi:hypothetical protein BLNAU_10755 [Blattamonas nauphoetae]|uniref:Uncharacterized protein n=1 Tax=Blattamonas nauphoetae TaxID=2049346 RepID=A0ABQ9XQB4_9EUKA|nr:hypothetical protein BLNAU_10755 [Blattamonas nauphoetae]
MDCSAFLNLDEGKFDSVQEQAVVFRSLVSTLKLQPSPDETLEAKVVKFLESVNPKDKKSADVFLHSFGRTIVESLTDFVQSVVVLLSSTNQVIVAAAMKMIRNLNDLCSLTVRLALVKADLIPQLINTLHPLSLSFAEAVDIHIRLMIIIAHSLYLATPRGLTQLGIEDDSEQQVIHETSFGRNRIEPTNSSNCFCLLFGQKTLFATIPLFALSSPPAPTPPKSNPSILAIPRSTELEGWEELLRRWKRCLDSLRLEGVDDTLEMTASRCLHMPECRFSIVDKQRSSHFAEMPSQIVVVCPSPQMTMVPTNCLSSFWDEWWIVDMLDEMMDVRTNRPNGVNVVGELKMAFGWLKCGQNTIIRNFESSLFLLPPRRSSVMALSKALKLLKSVDPQTHSAPKNPNGSQNPNKIRQAISSSHTLQNDIIINDSLDTARVAFRVVSATKFGTFPFLCFLLSSCFKTVDPGLIVLIFNFASFADGSLTDCTHSISVLLSSSNLLIPVAAMKMLDSLNLFCSAKVRLLLVKADLVPQIINTLNPLSVSFAEAVDIHTNLVHSIDSTIWLVTPSGLTYLEIEDDSEQQAVHETVLQQVVVPSEQYIWHLCVNRFSIVDDEQSKWFLVLLAQLFRICPYYQPTMDFVLRMPTVLTIPSCLTFFEHDQAIFYFLSEMNDARREWNIHGDQVQQLGKTVDRTLRMEGIEDVIETKLLNDNKGGTGLPLVDSSINWSNQQGMNLPELW